MPLGSVEGFSGTKLRELRREREMTIALLAVRCEVSEGTVRSWEKGRFGPNARRAYRLTDVLGVEFAALTDQEQGGTDLIGLRQRMGWTQDDAAFYSGLSKWHVSHSEKYVSPLQDRVRTVLACAYDVTEGDVQRAWSVGRERKYGTE